MQPEVEPEVIVRAVNGSRKAFDELISVYKKRVFYLCLKIIQNNEDAEEAAQDVFVKVFRKLKKFKGESKLSTWIFRIAYNESISKLRKTRKHQSQEDLDDVNIGFVEKAFEEIEQRERSLILEKAIDELDEESKVLVIMYYFHEKNIDEIAEIIRISKSNVKIRLFRARKAMLFVLEKKLKLSKKELI